MVFKNILYSILLLLCSTSIVFGSSSDFGFGKDNSVKSVSEININGTDDLKREDPLLDVIKGGVNRVLGILGLIALIVLLYGGLRMVTAAGDEEQYNSGFKFLKSAAIGILIIGVARFIISLFFWLSNLITENGKGGARTGE